MRFKFTQVRKLSAFTSHNILWVFVSFWLTILGMRSILFWLVSHGIFPWIIIRGYHIHHFVSGFIVIILSFFLIGRQLRSRYIPVLLFGGGMGLVVDEFIFWTLGDFNYWSLLNLAAVGIGAVIILLWYSQRKKKERELTLSVIRSVWVTSWPLILATAIGFVLLVELFSFENAVLEQAKNTIKDHQITQNLFRR
ncbi:MAG: hypothetical protein Q8P11_01005 [bacterium]|nr:hypothetical protein [bacterium]